MRQPALTPPASTPSALTPPGLARRSLLAGAGLGLLSGHGALAQPADPRLGDRGIGNPEAAVTVVEYFSLTCSHCAAFHKDVFPRIKRELIETGTIRMLWRDFPLDRLALTAAAVARALPPDRYEGFIGTLLSTQDRWAFTRGDQMAALAGVAALAGMPRSTFDAVVADEALQRGIMEQRAIAEKEAEVRATPSFSFKGRGAVRNVSGGMPFEEFLKLVDAARQA